MPRLIAEGGRTDIAALQMVDWPGLDDETLILAAEATVERADREITTRPSSDWMIESLIDVLDQLGKVATLPVPHTHRVLDCLQRMGRSVARATTVAGDVAQTLRSREVVRDQ